MSIPENPIVHDTCKALYCSSCIAKLGSDQKCVNCFVPSPQTDGQMNSDIKAFFTIALIQVECGAKVPASITEKHYIECQVCVKKNK